MIIGATIFASLIIVAFGTAMLFGEVWDSYFGNDD